MWKKRSKCIRGTGARDENGWSRSIICAKRRATCFTFAVVAEEITPAVTRKEGHTRSEQASRLSFSRTNEERAAALVHNRHGCESRPLWPWHWTCGRWERSETCDGKNLRLRKGTPKWGNAAELVKWEGIGLWGWERSEGGRADRYPGGREDCVISRKPERRASIQRRGDSPASVALMI